jgi:hypothetical protein
MAKQQLRKLILQLIAGAVSYQANKKEPAFPRASDVIAFYDCFNQVIQVEFVKGVLHGSLA